MLTVYSRIRADMNASIYYRLYLPLVAMHKLKLPVELAIDQETIDLSPMHRFVAMANADVVASYQAIAGELLQFMENMRGMPVGKDKAGADKWPPSFVFDTDDDLFNVDPLNPSFDHLGYKDDQGNELKPGQKVWIRGVEDNQPILLWSDGENINYAANKSRLDSWRLMLSKAELITCSTPAVERYVKREVPAAKTFIMPNCIDLSEFPRIDLANRPEVRILWQGSTTHWRDLWDIKEPLARVLKAHPEARIIFWTGNTNQWITSWLPKEQVEWMDWTPYATYKLRLNTIGHDINLAPLKGTTFNQCRSGIKWYESAACWKPAPTLAEAVEPYSEIEEGVTGMLYNSKDEFETKLTALVEDQALRREMGQNAKDWIKGHRDPSYHAMRLHDEYVKIREERKTWPAPKRAEKRRLLKTGRKIARRAAKSKAH